MWRTPPPRGRLSRRRRASGDALLRRHATGGRARNYDLFVAEVLPVLRRHDVGGDIGVRYGAEATFPAARAENL
jgi:hypothetical protein